PRGADDGVVSQRLQHETGVRGSGRLVHGPVRGRAMYGYRGLTALRLSLAFAAAGVAGCGGGAGTTENPVSGVTPPSSYNGPPPATADVQSFKLNVWDNVQASNRCGSCHTNSVGQVPLFARHDDINLAYEAANTVVDLTQPSASRLVTNLASGHNRWLTDECAGAASLTAWTPDWGP